MRRKINYARIVWIVCLFLLLIVILLMVMDYKINYEYLSSNRLYFYECSGEVCVMDVLDDEKILFSSYDCGYDSCPVYKKVISDDYALLQDGNKNILYQYKKGVVVSDKYKTYEFIDSSYIIVLKNGLYGIIDINGKAIVVPTYHEIGLHNN